LRIFTYYNGSTGEGERMRKSLLIVTICALVLISQIPTQAFSIPNGVKNFALVLYGQMPGQGGPTCPACGQPMTHLDINWDVTMGGPWRCGNWNCDGYCSSILRCPIDVTQGETWNMVCPSCHGLRSQHPTCTVCGHYYCPAIGCLYCNGQGVNTAPFVCPICNKNYPPYTIIPVADTAFWPPRMVCGSCANTQPDWSYYIPPVPAPKVEWIENDPPSRPDNYPADKPWPPPGSKMGHSWVHEPPQP
jgi:hypothetical protein